MANCESRQLIVQATSCLRHWAFSSLDGLHQPPGIHSLTELERSLWSPAGPSFMNTSANGGIVYGHKQYLGFLSPEQVRWLEASGVSHFWTHLLRDSVTLSSDHSLECALD